MQKHLDVKGMSCSACSTTIEKGLSKTKGVNNVSVNLLTNSLDIDFNEDTVTIDNLAQVVDDLGYKLVTGDETKTNNTYDDEEKQMKHRLIYSSILMVILFYISMGHMFNMPLPSFLLGHNNALNFIFTQFLICLPVYYLNRKFFINGFKSLFKGHPNMDSLIAIGSSSALIYGIYAIYSLGNAMYLQNDPKIHEIIMNLYFETGAMILTLITIGKYLESKSKKKTSDAIGKLVNLAPKMALIKENDQEVLKPIEEVRINDIEIIKGGEIIPSDGIIIKGTSSVDESMISGESIPVVKNINDKVIGATLNLNGYLEIKVTSTSENSTLSKIISLVENAANSKAPIARFADKVSGIFVPAVILISIVTFIVWFITTKDFENALNFAISVLVISCPCALGLATPVSIMVATGKAANSGILIRNGEAIEEASKITHVYLDKTGTISEGKVEVMDYISYDSSLEKIAFSLEKHSTHPLALGITKKFKGSNEIKFDEVNDILGKGIKGTIENDVYLAGNLKLMKEYNIEVNEDYNKYLNLGYTCIMVALNNKLLGIIGIADPIKDSSIKAIKDLKELGIKVTMLSGDLKNVAEAIANKCGIDEVISEVLPEDKENYIRKSKDNDVVAMVGDGINDSPALMRADVGIAIGSGSDIAIESADAILIKNDLNDVVNLIKLSKKTIINIKENLFWALIYNTIGIPLAAGLLYNINGMKLNPMFGAFAMSMSSIFVVSNALRLRKFKINNYEVKKMKKVMNIEGMMCEHCKGRVDKALNDINGVSATIDLDNNLANIEVNENISDEILIKAVSDAGYKVTGLK